MSVKLTSKKAFKVVKYLLQHPEISQLDLSKRTGVALGYVNTIVNFLVDLNIVTKESRRCILKNPVRLLEKIAFERPLNRLIATSFRLATTSIKEGEKIVNNACITNDIKYGFTVFSGMRRFYEYHITYPSIHVYISNIKIEEAIEHGEGPITLFLITPDHPDILMETIEIDGFSVCTKPQIAVDLFSSGVGRDAAIKFLEVFQDERYLI
ncbi:hypothetical protein DRO42_03455 [Candidatus Bathyarchaeota archaeon]|nr:MAG: hypothetical protein DRO42_03455 [Candidatus Bathyarchaeota archaeon]